MRIMAPLLIVKAALVVAGFYVFSLAIGYNVSLWERITSDLVVVLP